MKKNSNLADKLKLLLDNMSQEEFDKSWAEVKQLGLIGPVVAEYVEMRAADLIKSIQNQK